ncbi:MAG: hypothetical protein V1886_01505 [archaeon]
MGGNKMELELCSSGCCPKVRTAKDSVEIGETGNLVKLKKAEWNTLVDAVLKGNLGKI